jgi:ABC-type transport system substrate-binding protein
MRQEGIRLFRSKRLTTYYYAFNMDDPVVGANRALRQALGCAIDTAEYLDLFQNGLGTVAQSPIPPGISGYDPDYRNPNRQYDLNRAKALLAEAGYRDGKDPDTGEPLVIRYDTSANDASGRQATRWLVKQFEKLNIRLEVVVNDWNTQQQKADDGNFQVIGFAWLADYPDPENFLFLLHSENRRPGVNYANYDNKRYDGLFNRMKNMGSAGEEGQRRQVIIREMLAILEKDCPWVPNYHPEGFSLAHAWHGNMKLHGPGQNLLKYQKLDAATRAKLRKEWNRPNARAVGLLLAILVLAALPALWLVRRKRV